MEYFKMQNINNKIKELRENYKKKIGRDALIKIELKDGKKVSILNNEYSKMLEIKYIILEDKMKKFEEHINKFYHKIKIDNI